MWDIIIPVITFIVGLALGAVGSIYYLRRQMMNPKMDEKQLANMARSMGMNLNKKQLKQMNQRMQNMKFPK